MVQIYRCKIHYLVHSHFLGAGQVYHLPLPQPHPFSSERLLSEAEVRDAIPLGAQKVLWFRGDGLHSCAAYLMNACYWSEREISIAQPRLSFLPPKQVTMPVFMGAVVEVIVAASNNSDASVSATGPSTRWAVPLNPHTGP